MNRKSNLLIPLLLSGTAIAQPPGMFTPTGSMNSARSDHRATLLHSGKVLITGGQDVTGSSALVLSSAEVYDPATGTFGATGGMSVPRVGHSATLLSTGQVLIAGGQDDDFRYLPTAELYDPSTGTFTATGSMTAARSGHTATLLNDGKVLLTGGLTAPPSGDFYPDQLDSAELYDPSTKTFIPTGNMNAARSEHTATLLSDGRVLIDGGVSDSYLFAEIYDPADGTFRLVAGMPYDISLADATSDSATLLPTGNVLFTLLFSDGLPFDLSFSDDTTGSTALYNPSTAAFSPAPDVTEGSSQTATLLGDGTVFLAGLNYSDGLPTSTSHADLYDPVAGTVTATGSMISGRISYTATLLPDGTVLLAGGSVPWSVPVGSVTDPFSCVDTAEIYHPAVLVPSPVLYALQDATQGAVWHAATGQVASPSNPAVPGEVLSMYTNNLIEGGAIPPQVAIGGQLAEVLYFGDAPGYPGFFQVNFRVPSGVTPGPAVPVRLTYLDRPSNEVTVALQ